MSSRTFTLHQLSRVTGYARTRLFFAIQALGLALGGTASRPMVTAKERDRVVAYLAGLPDGVKLYAVAG